MSVFKKLNILAVTRTLECLLSIWTPHRTSGVHLYSFKNHPQRLYSGETPNFIIILSYTVVGVIAILIFFLPDEFGAVNICCIQNFTKRSIIKLLYDFAVITHNRMNVLSTKTNIEIFEMNCK